MITQDVQDAVARLLHAIDNSAPTVPLQAAPNWNAEMERQITATKNAQTLADQLEAVVDKERARADDLLKQLKQVCAERDQYGRAILRAADDCSELERQLAELTQLVGAETPSAALTLAQTWQVERAEMQERIAELEGDDVRRLSSIVESMYAKIGRSLPLETLSKLFIAVEGLRGAWNQLGRCVDEFEPEDMTACAEYRGFLDDAILAVLAVVPELQDDSKERPTITRLDMPQ